MATQFELPLLTDHHSHPLLYASFLQSVDLSNVTELDHACQLISDSAVEGSLAIGYGWKNNYFEFDQETLEKLPPAAIFNLSLHTLVVNSEGRKYLQSRYGQQINQMDNREWYEANLRVVLNWFALIGGSAEALSQFYSHLETIGVWSTEEMLLVAEEEILWYDQAQLTDRTRFWAVLDTYQSLSNGAKDRVAGIKLFTDGAFGARTAAISTPYADAPENYGMLVYSDESLATEIGEASALNKAIAIHAIGDRAIEQVLCVFESNSGLNNRFTEIRIEHAQIIRRDQAERAKRLGIKLSMQPNFTIDSTDYLDRLGPELASMNNPFRMLIDEFGFVPGEDLLFGSDGMPHGVQYALQQSLFPPHEIQRLSVDEFRAGYCVANTPGTITVSVDEESRHVDVVKLA